MIESLGLLFSVLAAVWVRKQDISSFLKDEVSRDQVVSNIIFPEFRFKRVMKSFLRFVEKFFESGAKFFFSIFMLSLFYVSISFVFSLNFVESKNLFFRNEMTSEDARTAFLIFCVSMPLTWVLGSTHNRHLSSKLINSSNIEKSKKRIEKINDKLDHKIYYITGAVFISIGAEVVYGSYLLTSFTIAVSILSALLSMHLMPFVMMKEMYARVFLGTVLGTLGLLLSVFSFASRNMASFDYVFIILICIMSAILALISLRKSVVIPDPEYRDFWRFAACSEQAFDRMASLIGRPSLFVGFHCARAGGPFCAAVSVILVNVAIARTMVPDAVVCAGSIMLACIVFFSGATTLAGAGLFALGVVLLIGVYMALSPELLFSVWAAPFLLWILLPVVNSAIDYARWSIARRNMARYVKRADAVHARVLFLDLFYAAAGFLIYVFVTFSVLKLFDGIALNYGSKLPFDIDEINSSIKGGVFREGVWLLVMAGTMLIPSAIQAAIFLYSGLLFIFPRKYRYSLSKDVRVARSPYEIDAVAWRVSALDIMGRIVLGGCLLISFIAIGIQIIPLLDKLTSLAGDYGVAFGKMLLSWALAR